MSSCFSYDNRCVRCGNRGHVFWSEGGHRDQYERITAIWGEFRELPPDPAETLNGSARGTVVCARCGQPETDGPRRHIPHSRPGQPPDEDLMLDTAYVTIVPLDGAVVVRTYVKGDLAAEARVTPRRAVLLAQDALNGAVAVGYRAPGPDQPELDRALNGRVVGAPRKFAHGG